MFHQMFKGLKKYGAEDKIIVMDETFIQWEKSRQSLQILCHSAVTENGLWVPVHLKDLFLNLLFVNIVLISVLK